MDAEERDALGRNLGHREAIGFPSFGEHTWDHGRDRLLLGYAMADGTNATFCETLPCEGIEGTATELLGRWLDFQQQLFAVLDELRSRERLRSGPIPLTARSMRCSCLSTSRGSGGQCDSPGK